MLQPGLVVSHLGRSLAVETEQGEIVTCQTRRRLETVAVGDRVEWQVTGPQQGRVETVLPRRSLLSRPARNGRLRPVAANLDQVMVVFAVEPACDFLLIDQYLVVCEQCSIEAQLVFNKIDLIGADSAPGLEQQLGIYRDLGYVVHCISTKTGTGMNALTRALQGRVSMLAGQSGVGKSSLGNTLLPGRTIRVGGLSEGSGHGRHTTTAANLYHLPQGGGLIDSPGVAVFGLANIDGPALALGYREFGPYLGRCRFNDCRHLQDQGCAVRHAAEAGEIHAQRYQRFRKLYSKLPRIS